MPLFYKHWAKLSPFLALVSLSFLFWARQDLSTALFWIWLQYPLYLIHEFEEHVWPGQFKTFLNREIFHSKQPNWPVDDAAVFWINILAIWFLFPLVGFLAQIGSPQIGVFLPLFSLFNATTHLIAFAVKKKYNPGLFCSLTLNYPFGIYALVVLWRQGLLSWTVSNLALALSVAIHLALIAWIMRRVN